MCSMTIVALRFWCACEAHVDWPTEGVMEVLMELSPSRRNALSHRLSRIAFNSLSNISVAITRFTTNCRKCFKCLLVGNKQFWSSLKQGSIWKDVQWTTTNVNTLREHSRGRDVASVSAERAYQQVPGNVDWILLCYTFLFILLTHFWVLLCKLMIWNTRVVNICSNYLQNTKSGCEQTANSSSRLRRNSRRCILSYHELARKMQRQIAPLHRR